MPTVGWVFILIGAIIIRQAIKGRALNQIPGDIGDILRGAATSLQSPSDGASIIKDVLARTGQTLTYNSSILSGGSTTGISTPGTDANSVTQGLLVLSQMKTLASAAGNKYVWGASGPNAYDCSGLVWAAMKSVKYTGLRFTTYTFVAQLGARIAKVDTPITGDVVLWPSHMGVMDSSSTMFSALNPNEGIKSSPLSYGPKNEGNPTFWRFTGSFN